MGPKLQPLQQSQKQEPRSPLILESLEKLTQAMAQIGTTVQAGTGQQEMVMILSTVYLGTLVLSAQSAQVPASRLTLTLIFLEVLTHRAQSSSEKVVILTSISLEMISLHRVKASFAPHLAILVVDTLAKDGVWAS